MATTTQLAKRYAHILSGISVADLAREHSSYTKQLVGHLQRTGRMKLLPNILRALKEEQSRRQAREPVVEIACEEDRDIALVKAASSGIRSTTAIVNPKLIRGWRARANGILVDNSAKHSLIELYRNIIR